MIGPQPADPRSHTKSPRSTTYAQLPTSANLTNSGPRPFIHHPRTHHARSSLAPPRDTRSLSGPSPGTP
ncbi:hypothetical protein ACFQ0Q_25205 [Streptomyces aureus]